jgi:N4-(beta-N-acetylglucosaminyl)-L-asparaginase
MRQGLSPEKACKKAVERLVKRDAKKAKENQVGFIAINKSGEHGGYCLQKGFNYAVCYADDKNFMVDGKSWF